MENNNTLTNENYFSPENNLKYMGSSQFKTFLDCESRGYAETNGLYLREKTTALLVGSFVDAHFSNEMNLFRAQNPDIFKKDGSLKSEYLKAEQIIQRIESDRMMMEFLDGEKQKIMTGCICGVYFKIKIDVLHNDKIVDLKILRDFESIWNGTERVDFVEAWGYDIQASIYQEIERQNRGEYAEPLPFYLACSTKENEPDIEIFQINQSRIDAALQIVRNNAPRFHDIKMGRVGAGSCGVCDWCKKNKILTEVRVI